MNRFPREAAAWVFVAALGIISKEIYDGRRRAEGRAAIETAARERAEFDLRNARTRVDTVYSVDTISFWRTVERTERLLDTLRLSDTVVLTQRESVLVFVADSVVNQCKSIISLCEERVAVRDSLLRVVGADRDYFKRRAEPSRLTAISTAAKWLAIGFAIGALR